MSDGGLRKIFSDHLKAGHWQTLETWSTGKGVPDSNVCFWPGIEVWIEFKATSTFRLDISPEQVSWAERRMRAGGRVFLAARRQTTAGPKKGPAVDELWLFTGVATRWLIAHPMTRDTAGFLGAWAGGPKGWDWGAVQVNLLRKPL